jgi:hypothetical protein
MTTNNQVENKVVSIQIMPYFEEPAAYDSSEFISEQFDGPTSYTSGFFIRLRMEKDVVRRPTGTEYDKLKLVASAVSQDDADFIAQAYATRYGVDVEPQSWKQK